MQAKDYPLSVVLQERQQWVIPVYQRTYAWDTKSNKQLPQLWDDLHERALERLGGLKPKPHFVGAIIYSQPNDQPFGTVNKRFLVDGQQRITTFSLVLCALRECSRDEQCERLFSTIEEYLFNAKSASMAEPEREQFKLWSSSYDRPFYIALAQKSTNEIRSAFPKYFYNNGNIIWGQSFKILAAYWYLREQISIFLAEQKSDGAAAETVLDAVLSGFLTGFQIVVVQLGQEDDAQSIFSSLNGNAEPLTSFDLIRNDIFHRARKALENDETLYDDLWKNLETEFWKEEVKQGRLKRPRTDHLITHTMVAEMAQDINVGQVSNEYRKFAELRAFGSVSDEVQALLKYARVYEEMEQRTKGQALAKIAEFLGIWDMSALHPIVLWVSVQDIDQENKDSIYKIIETYIIRRDICNLTNKNYNKVTATLLRDMHNASDVMSTFVSHLMALTGDASRMPNDAELTASVVRNPLYTQIGSRKLRYIFSKIEQFLRNKFDETVSIELDNLTVEHILPSAWSKKWPLPCGEMVPTESYYDLIKLMPEIKESIRNEMEAREVAKHTLGNLTLLTTSLNPSIGNLGWSDKQSRISGSLLALNRHIVEHESWNEGWIENRSHTLAAAINVIWHYLS